MIKNQFKTVLLLGVLTSILLIIGSFWGASGLAIALVFSIAMNVGSYFYSHKLVLKLYKAKEITQIDNPELHNIVEEVSKEAKVPKPKIYLIPSESPNAFCTGPNPKKAVLGYTQGILNLLDKEELKGVTAHEIAHDKNRDMLITTIAATIAAVISYAAIIARFGAMFGGYRERDSGNMFQLLALAIVAPLAATIIQLAISRSREFVADATGAKLANSTEGLSSALKKIHTSVKTTPMTLGHPSTSSLFIANPFKGSFVSIFSTHPSLEKRLKRLEDLKI